MLDQARLNLEREVHETWSRQADLRLATNYMRSWELEKADNILTAHFLYDPENKEVIEAYKKLANSFADIGEPVKAMNIARLILDYNNDDIESAKHLVEVGPFTERERAKIKSELAALNDPRVKRYFIRTRLGDEESQEVCSGGNFYVYFVSPEGLAPCYTIYSHEQVSGFWKTVAATLFG